MITPADLIARFGEEELKTLLRKTSQAIDMKAPLDSDHPALLAACQDASSIAAGFLRKTYSLPFAQVPAVVVAYCADIARYRLHSDQNIDGTSVQRARYEDALQWLEKVAAGELQLDVAASEAAPLPESPYPIRTGKRVAVVSPPLVIDQVMLGKMDVTRH